MSVFQFGQHVAHYVEEAVLTHRVGDEHAVFVVDGIPIDAFEFEEAVVLIHDSPQILEVVTPRVVVFRIAVATGKKQQGCQEEKEDILFHTLPELIECTAVLVRILDATSSEGDELLHEADHERMGDDMIVNPVDIRLIPAADVTEAHRHLADGKIHRQIILHRQFVMERAELHDAGIIPEVEYLVVGLSVMRREEHAGEGNVGLQADDERKLSNPCLPDAESRNIQIGIDLSRCGIIAVARVIDETAHGMNGRSGEKLELRIRLELVMISQTVVHKSGEIRCGASSVVGGSHVSADDLLA